MAITPADNLDDTARYPNVRDWDRAITYTTGAGAEFAGARVTATTSPDEVADLILAAMPRAQTTHPDPEYARWYDELMRIVERHHALPIAYADYYDSDPGWEIGWGSGRRHTHPPAAPPQG